MDIDRVRRLLGQVSRVYESGRMVGLQEWARQYPFSNGDGEYVERVVNLIGGMNTSGPAERLMGIDDLVIEELLHYTGFRSEIGREMAKMRKQNIRRG